MAPVTEIATLPLATGIKIEDPTSPAGQSWATVLDTLQKQEGYQRSYYGRQLEDPQLVQLFIDWDSYESHETFMKSTVYGPTMQHLASILDGPIDLKHASFDPHPPSNAVGESNAPVTEVLLATLSSKDEDYAINAAKFAKLTKDNANGCKGASTGWIREQVEHEKLDEAQKGFAYAIVIGWESKDVHLAFRETTTFRENISLIRDGAQALQVNHTSFNEI